MLAVQTTADSQAPSTSAPTSGTSGLIMAWVRPVVGEFPAADRPPLGRPPTSLLSGGRMQHGDISYNPTFAGSGHRRAFA